MKIRLLTVGKPENPQFKAAIDMYLKRIKHYTAIEMDFIKPEKIAKLSESEILEREKIKLEKKLSPTEYTIVMDKGGKQFSSTEFANWIQNQQNNGRQSVTIIIGGPHGLAPEIVSKAEQKVSFSKMTFPHELAAVMLLEQIYRAHTILRGEKYHK